MYLHYRQDSKRKTASLAVLTISSLRVWFVVHDNDRL